MRSRPPFRASPKPRFLQNNERRFSKASQEMSWKVHWLWRNFSHLVVKLYFALKRIVLSSASLFQMRVASTVAAMYQKAMTGCLIIALHRVFLRVNWFVISNKLKLDTTNKRMLQFWTNKTYSLVLGPSLLYSIAAIHQRACLTFNYKCSTVYIIKYTTKQWKKACN